MNVKWSLGLRHLNQRRGEVGTLYKIESFQEFFFFLIHRSCVLLQSSGPCLHRHSSWEFSNKPAVLNFLSRKNRLSYGCPWNLLIVWTLATPLYKQGTIELSDLLCEGRRGLWVRVQFVICNQLSIFSFGEDVIFWEHEVFNLTL